MYRSPVTPPHATPLSVVCITTLPPCQFADSMRLHNHHTNRVCRTHRTSVKSPAPQRDSHPRTRLTRRNIWVSRSKWLVSKSISPLSTSTCHNTVTSVRSRSVPTFTPANVTGCLVVTTSIPDSAPLDTSTHPYLSLIGCVLWVTITRPDISTAVSRACQRSKSMTMVDWLAVMFILRYLLTTVSHGLLYRAAARPLIVTAHVDAAFANESKQRSRYGFVVFLSGVPIMWTTRSATMVCLSTAEAEFVDVTEASKNVVWVCDLLVEIGSPCVTPYRVSGRGQSGLHQNDHQQTTWSPTPPLSRRLPHPPSRRAMYSGGGEYQSIRVITLYLTIHTVHLPIL